MTFKIPHQMPCKVDLLTLLHIQTQTIEEKIEIYVCNVFFSETH